MARLFWNAIVKNEADRIERALDSITQFVDGFVVLDTGSTDGTVEKIKDYAAFHHVYCNVRKGEFINFSQARNDALRLARADDNIGPDDYLLLMDADMELRVRDRSVFNKLTAPSYDMFQETGVLHYANRRLLKKSTKGEYRGVTHEFLDEDQGGVIPEEIASFYDHADGANRPDKFKRDIRLLLAGLKDEPRNERYYYYLAQSYRDAGQLDRAIHWYRRRIDFGGWEEERWSAQENMALCYRAMGNEAEFIRQMMKAYSMRPSRAEAPYQLANHFRLKGDNFLGAMFAKEAMQIPRTSDGLFVNDYAYSTGPLEELSITGYYTERHKMDGFIATNILALSDIKYGGARDLAKHNMYYYLSPLKEACPSAVMQEIDFKPPAGWHALNPSITVFGGKMYAIIRTVNYTMDDDGRYLIRDLEGQKEPSDSNPINTRNWLVQLDNDFKVIHQNEVLPPGNMPAPQFKPVIGFEDMRLFEYKDQLWTSSCVREQNENGVCEQIRARINHTDHCELTDLKKMIKAPFSYEKNWMPIQNKMEWVYRLGEVVNDDAKTVHHAPIKGMDVGHISGGSQLIKWGDGYLSLVHEARPLPDKPWKRYYWHRFVMYDDKGLAQKVSMPFVFQDRQIEFAAGLCEHPDGHRLVISAGIRDSSAWIITIDRKDIWRMIWSHSK